MRGWVWSDYVPGTEYAAGANQVGLSDEDVGLLAFGYPLTAAPSELFIPELWPPRILPDVMATSFGGTLLRTSVRRCVERFAEPDQLEFVRARVIGFPDDEYWLVNFLAIHPCIDVPRSRVTFDEDAPGRIEDVDALVPLPLDGAPAVFHSAELRVPLVVREDLHAALQAFDSPGRFEALEDFTW